MGARSLTAIRRELEEQLGPSGGFAFVNTRLVLRTGVSLSSIRAEQDHDETITTKVLEALAEMGFAFGDGGQRD